MSALSRPLSEVSRATAPHVAREGTLEDAALVMQLRVGDRAAEATLYQRHAEGVLRLATRLLASHDDAMDVLQDTFVAAFENVRDLRDPSAFRPWLHRVAVRLVHRRFRRRKLLGLLGLHRTGEDAPLEALADESATAEARAELQWLDVALRKLADAERIAWMLRHVEGLALEEVADACDCSLATAKRRIAAADAVARAHVTDGGRS